MNKFITFKHSENKNIDRKIEMIIVKKTDNYSTADYVGEFKGMSRYSVVQSIGETWVKSNEIKGLNNHEFWDFKEISDDVFEIFRNISHKLNDDDREKLKDKYGY